MSYQQETQYGRVYKRKRPKANLIGKMCFRCKEYKLIDEFNLLSSSRDGHEYVCRECQVDDRKKRKQRGCKCN